MANPGYSAWMSLRRVEPLRWSSFMNDCATILGRGEETELDILLVTQARCHVAMGNITCAYLEPAVPDEESAPAPIYLMKALEMQLESTRQSVPQHLQSNSEYSVTISPCDNI